MQSYFVHTFSAKAQAHRRPAADVSNQNIPDSFDWREKGGVTPVKFQGKCHSRSVNFVLKI